MKSLLSIIFFLQSIQLFSQSKFVIDGKTNALVNGKAIINMMAPYDFYPFKLKKDTVLIRKHSFVFTGILKYPERFRIETIDNNNNNSSLSEPFFINAGYHKMTIDTASDPHDSLEIGSGVNLQNDRANDEYIKKYLPLYNQVSKQYDDYDRATSTCNSIADKKKRRGCELAAEEELASIRKRSDNVLLTYTKAYRRSPIVPWLLYDLIFRRGYRDAYQEYLTNFQHTLPQI